MWGIPDSLLLGEAVAARQPGDLVTPEGQERPEQLHVVGASSTIRIFATVSPHGGKKYATVQANATPASGLEAGTEPTKRQDLKRLRS